MNTIRNVCIAIALASGISMTAHAAPVIGTGGGYYGSAWYDSGQGSVVAGASTWAECTSALQMSINHAVNVFGWQVVTYNPCHYRPPFGEMVMQSEKTGVAIEAGSAGESGGVVEVLTQDIRRAREQYRADDYENALRTIYQAGSGR